jgi:hypothetical protein
MLIHGSCHCGNIGFELEWEPDPQEIIARECDCSFCTRHGGLWTSYPAGILRVTVQDPARHSAYSFGTGTALFHVCSRCGAVPVVSSRLDGRDYAVVSVTAFTNVDPALIRRSSASFEGESREERLARRKRNWIGAVEFTAGTRAQ